MTQFGHCPACHRPIPQDRIFGTVIVCECGWTASSYAKAAERRVTDRISAMIIVFAMVLIGAFIHAINWDTYFFAVIPLKAKEMTGTANTQDLFKIVEICKARHKHSCVKDSYKQIYRLNKDINILAKLGELQQATGDVQAAVHTFKEYVKLGGKDAEPTYRYAQVLAGMGQVDEAIRFYRQVLDQKPDTLQITVTRSYVSMLIENKRYEHALEVIQYYRKKADNTGYFMEKELQALNRILKKDPSSKRS
ncbi:MAG: tetratricopeptide repeat protein [Bdellovibrionales bacterium]|nr:tetratricopeptide repeat protein [Bdellovibrionales bacterium]